MSRHLSPFAAKLRRQLLAKGLTLKPTCEACGLEVEPKAIQAGLCPGCKAERDEAAAYFQRLSDETDWPILAESEYPIFGGPEAERPFLEEDEDYWTHQQRRRGMTRQAPCQRCVLPNGHSGDHLMVRTADPTPRLGECRGQS